MTGILSALRNWQERREILRDIRRVKADDKERSYFKAKDDLTEALATVDFNDNRKATEIWINARERYPDHVATSPLALQLLLKLHRFDEAEELMQSGRRKYRGQLLFARGLAEVAFTRGDYASAVERFAALRKQFPAIAQGYVMGAGALAAMHRMAEADALVQEAINKFPEDVSGFLEYGRLAVHREDWPEALRRWQLTQEKFPDRIFGYLGGGQALLKLGRPDEAETLLAGCRSSFPLESGVLAELARCAQMKGNIPEAAARWKRRVERFPMERHGYFEAAKALEEIGAMADAEAVLRDAVHRFPTDPGAGIELAKLLSRQGDFAREAEAWADVRQAFPDHQEPYWRGAEALRQSGQPDAAAALLEEHKQLTKV